MTASLVIPPGLVLILGGLLLPLLSVRLRQATLLVLPLVTLYLVWQHQRAGNELYGDFRVSRDVNAIFRQRSDNIFAIKASYWIGR